MIVDRFIKRKKITVQIFFVIFYRPDWILTYQGMVILAGSQVWWTWEVEDVFTSVKKGNKLGMKNYAKKMHQQIGDLVVKVSSCYIFLTPF